ncbi:D-alanine--D-alanine ligase [Bacillaceae bacterium S4-13-58]
MSKIKIGIIFGGKSSEHEVSLQSAKNVFEALDKTKYDPILIGIDKEGRWHLNDQSQYLLNADNPKLIQLNKSNKGVAIIPGEEKNQVMNLSSSDPFEQLDVVFPILHGPLGEDGSIQGMLRMANIPFVGPGVLGSAVSMDKDIAKRLLKEAGFHVAKGFAFTKAKRNKIDFAKIETELGLPMFIKPANQGSSVGVSKVKSADEFEKAVDTAFEFDNKILIEEAIVGREIECSVLGNEDPKASILGEIVAQRDFYSYEAKYIDETGALLEIPAKLPEELSERVREEAVRAFETLGCEGLSRVDFFVTEDEKIIVNEINTIPGFTKISMYPKLWEKTGISYSDLIDQLIQLAIDRFERDSQLKNTVEFD